MASITRSTANRAVHLRITPRPSNLGESREIYRLMSEFGHIEYFKNLKYDTLSAPNTALVIFRDEDAAKNCLHKSPIRFRMGKAPVEAPPRYDQPSRPQEPAQQPPTPREPASSGFSERPAPFGLSQTRSMSTRSYPDPPPRPRKLPFEPPPPPPLLESRIFQIQTNPARVHFRDQINMGAYHGNFALDTKSIPQKNLAKTVPILGLSCVDWRATERPWRIAQKEVEREHKGPNRRKSLRELYEEGPEGKATQRDESLPG